MSKAQSANGSESEFEFIETPKAPTPTFEKFEECGVRTTSVSSYTSPRNLIPGIISHLLPVHGHGIQLPPFLWHAHWLLGTG